MTSEAFFQIVFLLFFFNTFVLLMFFVIVKISNFRSDLTDVSN